MNKNTRRIAVTALMTALSVIFIYLASILPTGLLALTAAASLFCIAAVIECGFSAAGFVYIGTNILSLLLVSDKSVILPYACFFGYYPILKSLIERTGKMYIEWVLKLLVFNTAFLILKFVFSSVIFDISALKGSFPLLLMLFNAAFVIFDIGVTKLIVFYIFRISKNIKH